MWNMESGESWSAGEWSNGCCDLIAVAIHRLYGLPLHGEFEAYADGSTGFLAHAFCVLPDGRAIDASGPDAPYFSDPDYRDPCDPKVCGYVVIETSETDPRLTEVRDFEYDTDVDDSGAPAWVLAHLRQTLADLGIPLVMDVAVPLIAAIIADRARRFALEPPDDAVAILVSAADMDALLAMMDDIAKFEHELPNGESCPDFMEFLGRHGIRNVACAPRN